MAELLDQSPAPCTMVMAWIFSVCASSEMPWSDCLSVETRAYPTARMVACYVQPYRNGSYLCRESGIASERLRAREQSWLLGRSRDLYLFGL